MNKLNENPFVIEDMPIKNRGTDIQRPKPLWDISIIFGTEPRLAIIAVDAATAKWLWKKARIAAFEAAMDKAGNLVGEDAHDPRLRDNAAWDCFHDYILEHLRL